MFTTCSEFGISQVVIDSKKRREDDLLSVDDLHVGKMHDTYDDTNKEGSGYQSRWDK